MGLLSRLCEIRYHVQPLAQSLTHGDCSKILAVSVTGGEGNTNSCQRSVQRHMQHLLRYNSVILQMHYQCDLKYFPLEEHSMYVVNYLGFKHITKTYFKTP